MKKQYNPGSIFATCTNHGIDEPIKIMRRTKNGYICPAKFHRLNPGEVKEYQRLLEHSKEGAENYYRRLFEPKFPIP